MYSRFVLSAGNNKTGRKKKISLGSLTDGAGFVVDEFLLSGDGRCLYVGGVCYVAPSPQLPTDDDDDESLFFLF